MSSETLYGAALDSGRGSQIEPRDAVLAVHHFLGRCRDYAREREIPALLERIGAEPNPGHAAKLHQWTSWVAFVEHAMREIEAGTLDSWFVPPPRSRTDP